MNTKKEINEDPEITDTWRYALCDVWKLDKLTADDPSNDTEDNLIEQIDAHQSPLVEQTDSFNAMRIMESVLTDRQFKIVYWYLWEGYSFADIATALGVNRARSHVLYKNALKALKPHLDKFTTKEE